MITSVLILKSLYKGNFTFMLTNKCLPYEFSINKKEKQNITFCMTGHIFTYKFLKAINYTLSITSYKSFK